jgi:hypothetical protein
MYKPTIDIPYLKQRFTQMQNDRAPMEYLYEEVARYVLDRESSMNSGHYQVGLKSKRNYSKEGVLYNLRFAAALQGFVSPAEQRWFSLETTKPLNQISYESRVYLDQLEETLYALFASTNYYQQSLEMITDYASFGRGTMLILPDPEKMVKFITIPMRETYIDTDLDNRINTVVRHFTKSNKAIYDEFKNDAQWPTEFTQSLHTQEDAEVEVLHFSLPNPQYVPQSKNINERKYLSIYLYNGAQQFILKKSFYNSNPYLTPRWTVLSGEKEGRSQAMLAVSDIRALSSMKNDMLGGIQLLNNPTWMVHSGSVAGAALNRRPGGVIPIKEPIGGTIGNAIVPMPQNARPDIALNVVQYYSEQIAKMFFADIIAEDKNAEMSATEASTRQMLRIANMAPQIGRLTPEYLDPLFPRVISILIDNNHIPPIPDDLKDMKIEYRSPLAKAQKMQAMDGITQFGQFIQQWGSMDPSIYQTIKPEEIIMQAAIATDIPSRILKSPQELKEMKEQQQQQMEQQQQLQASESVANSQAKLATAANQLSEGA